MKKHKKKSGATGFNGKIQSRDIDLSVVATLFDGDPLRFRTQMAAGNCGGHAIDVIEVSLCASGSHIYLRANGRQVAIALKEICRAGCVHLLDAGEDKEER